MYKCWIIFGKITMYIELILSKIQLIVEIFFSFISVIELLFITYLIHYGKWALPLSPLKTMSFHYFLNLLNLKIKNWEIILVIS